MKITIEVPDITTAAIAVNNATAAYGNILYAAKLQCEVPKGFECLLELDDETMLKQFDCLKSISDQIRHIEVANEVLKRRRKENCSCKENANETLG